MTAANAKFFGDSMVALRERKRIVDAIWLSSLAILFVALLVPWFFRVIEFNLEALALSVLTYGLAYSIMALVTDRQSFSRVGIGLRAMQASSVFFLALMWHLVGGLDNPMFLLAFILPVMTSGATMIGWRPYAIALLSVLCVLAVALIESPDLRWYLTQLGLPVSWVGAWLPPGFPSRVQPFPGLRTPPAFQLMLLEIFIIVVFAVAFMSTPLVSLLLRLYSRLQVSAQSLRELQGLFQAVLQAEPEPGLIVYADTEQVVHASSSFFKRMLLMPSDIVGKSLFELIQFEQPERLRDALKKERGEVPFCVYRVGPETRIANVNFYRTEHEGTAYFYLGLQEVTDLYYLHAAFNAMGDPLVVISINQELLYANRAGQALFGTLHLGMTVQNFIRLARLYDEWRGLGEHSARTYRTDIDFRPYEVSGVVAQLPGEAAPCTILWLHSVAREEALFEEVVRDPLTGLYNRRHFHDTLTRMVASVKRGNKLACAYLDLDYFKAINDDLGHAGGDAALLDFVDAVRNEVRATDVFARLGGDEFALALADSEASTATALLDRVHKRLAGAPFTFQEQVRPLSFSAGVANCRPEDQLDDLLDRADRALYKAKEAGRGICVIEE